MSFVATGASGFAGGSAAEIFGAWKFVARVVDDIVIGKRGRDVGAELLNLDGDEDGGKDGEPGPSAVLPAVASERPESPELSNQ